MSPIPAVGVNHVNLHELIYVMHFIPKVLVFSPSTSVFSEMMRTYLDAPNYNRGDQGFINWFFSNHSGIGINPLPVTYNVPPKVKVC